MKKIKIGIIAPLSGQSKKTGEGYTCSAEYVIHKKNVDFKKLGYCIELIKKDDRQDHLLSVEHAIDLVRSECVAILCPTDTISTYNILKSQQASEIPLISSFSTASFLSLLGCKNFYRFTTPDSVRAEILVRFIRPKCPKCRVHVYILKDSQFSYSQQISNDVISSLKKNRIEWIYTEFDPEINELTIPEKNIPIIICSPSLYAVKLIKYLRSKGGNNLFYSFGSNSNFLVKESVGTIVVCDLDREDSNPFIREELDHFNKIHENQLDPSISTINAMYCLLNMLLDIITVIDDIPTPQLIYQLNNSLKSNILKGIYGPISFTIEGEMAGHEHISLLRVSKNRNKIHFSPVNKDYSPSCYKRIPCELTPSVFISILGSIASIVSLIIWFSS